MPFFSIVITCYNQEKYINDALNSIKKQDFESFECIVVDDGSTDQSLNVIQSFIRDDKRFRLVVISHQGQAAARNAGIYASNGKYVLFLDGDDAYLSNCLSECYFVISAHKATNDLIIFGIQNTFYDKNDVKIKTEFAVPKQISFANGRELAAWYVKNHAILLYSSSNKAYNLECLKRNNLLFDKSIKFGEDRIFNYDFLKYAGPIETIQKCLLDYRHINPNSLSSCFIPHYIDTTLFLHDEKKKHLLPLADAADESVIADFVKYDYEKEVNNAEQMIENNKSGLSESEYEEEWNYFKNRIKQGPVQM